MTEKKKIECWLIQRCSLQTFPRDKPGFDAMFSCDYMGSAEFEFGSLPDSLRAVCSNLDAYDTWPTRVKSAWGEPVYIYGPREDRDAINQAFRVAFLSPRPYLKERTRFNENLGRKDPAPWERFSTPLTDQNKSGRIVLWWDIVNHFFVTCGTEVTGKLVEALSVLRDRWVGEGKIQCQSKKPATAIKRSNSPRRSKKSSTPRA